MTKTVLFNFQRWEIPFKVNIYFSGRLFSTKLKLVKDLVGFSF